MTKFRDLIGGVFFLAFSVFIYALSYQIHMTKADPVGPQFFPRLVALLMAVLALASIVRSVLRLRAHKAVASAGTDTQKPGRPTNYAFPFTILLLIGYMLLIDTIGFILLSIPYLFVQIYLISPQEDLQKKNLLLNGIVALVVPIALYYLFYHAFGIFLPPGLLD